LDLTDPNEEEIEKFFADEEGIVPEIAEIGALGAGG
jgi:hypothetical protein